MKTLGLLAFIIVTLAVGVACLWRPDRVQRLAIQATARGMTSRSAALNRFVGSRQYLINVRAVGILALLMAAFLLWMMIKN
jgi:hypothetical protein